MERETELAEDLPGFFLFFCSPSPSRIRFSELAVCDERCGIIATGGKRNRLMEMSGVGVQASRRTSERPSREGKLMMGRNVRVNPSFVHLLSVLPSLDPVQVCSGSRSHMDNLTARLWTC